MHINPLNIFDSKKSSLNHLIKKHTELECTTMLEKLNLQLTCLENINKETWGDFANYADSKFFYKYFIRVMTELRF